METVVVGVGAGHSLASIVVELCQLGGRVVDMGDMIYEMQINVLDHMLCHLSSVPCDLILTFAHCDD